MGFGLRHRTHTLKHHTPHGQGYTPYPLSDSVAINPQVQQNPQLFHQESVRQDLLHSAIYLLLSIYPFPLLTFDGSKYVFLP